MEKLRSLIFSFACITTGTLMATTIFTTIFYHNAQLSSNILWQILAVSAICSFGNFMYPERELSKKQLNVLTILHYFYINLIVIGGAIVFDWINVHNWMMILGLVILVAITFIVITWINYVRTKKDSFEINQRLQEYRKNFPAE